MLGEFQEIAETSTVIPVAGQYTLWRQQRVVVDLLSRSRDREEARNARHRIRKQSLIDGTRGQKRSPGFRQEVQNSTPRAVRPFPRMPAQPRRRSR